MKTLPLEDTWNDIVQKAMRGLGIGPTRLATTTGLPEDVVKRFVDGEFDEEIARRVAGVLGLSRNALVALAKNEWSPAPLEVAGLAVFTTPWHDMMVNHYLAWDEESKDAVAFDTGTDCTALLDFLKLRGLNLRAILLTHTHADHVFELDRLASKTGAPAYVGNREPLSGAELFAAGREFAIGSLKIESRLTWGHSKGGITFVIDGLPRKVAVVGDAIFAGSMGGGMESYSEALRTNQEEILTLPDDTVLCPGHGPLTTVGEQKAANPFFAR